MLTRQENKQVVSIKKSAIELYQRKCITKKLCQLILTADYEDKAYVKRLMLLTEELIRTKGYYHCKERIESCDLVIEQWLTNTEF